MLETHITPPLLHVHTCHTRKALIQSWFRFACDPHSFTHDSILKLHGWNNKAQLQSSGLVCTQNQKSSRNWWHSCLSSCRIVDTWKCQPVTQSEGHSEPTFEQVYTMHDSSYSCPSLINCCENRWKRTAHSLQIYKIAQEFLGDWERQASREGRSYVEPSSWKPEFWYPIRISCER